MIVALALLPLLALAPASRAGTGIDAEATVLMCDAGNVIDCDDGECSAGSPESVDLPRFIRIDLDASAQLTQPRLRGRSHASHVDRPRRRFDHRLWQGPAGRVFVLSISEQTGMLKGSVPADEFAFLIYGGSA